MPIGYVTVFSIGRIAPAAGPTKKKAPLERGFESI
jgi:hypothetical protein